MDRPLKAFEVRVKGKTLDYRVGQAVDLNAVQEYFEKNYSVKKIWNAGRHVLGRLTKDGKDYFLKLAASEGISAVTQNEYHWNKTFNDMVPRESSEFWAPVNVEEGWFTKELYYFITDVLDGFPLAERPEPGALRADFSVSVSDIIRFSEHIQKLPVEDRDAKADHRHFFITKVTAWYEAIPVDIRQFHNVGGLLSVVKAGIGRLSRKARHGDFTPWHIMKLTNGKLGLIDGEHFLSYGVQYYDIGYFIQRVYSVLEAPSVARDLYALLIRKGYDAQTLRVILAARGIGGYLDASLANSPAYTSSRAFGQWVTTLG